MLVGRQMGRALLAGIAAAVVAAACGSNGTGTASPPPVDVGSGSLTGAGATFPAPFYQKAFFDYNAKYPNVTVNYQSVGSGAGTSQFQKGTVDFGASDVPMGDADIAKVTGGAAALTQIPTTLGVISIAYNLSGVSKLQLDGPTLANIFLGHITKWNDAAITDLTAVAPRTTSPTTSARCRASGSRTSASPRRSSGRRASAPAATRALRNRSHPRPERSATSSSLTWCRQA